MKFRTPSYLLLYSALVPYVVVLVVLSKDVEGLKFGLAALLAATLLLFAASHVFWRTMKIDVPSGKFTIRKFLFGFPIYTFEDKLFSYKFQIINVKSRTKNRRWMKHLHWRLDLVAPLSRFLITTTINRNSVERIARRLSEENQIVVEYAEEY